MSVENEWPKANPDIKLWDLYAAAALAGLLANKPVISSANISAACSAADAMMKKREELGK